MAFFKIDPDQVGARRGGVEVDEECFEVWKDNAKTLAIFLSLRNHWHIVAAPDGELVRTGIRASAITLHLKHLFSVPAREWSTTIRMLRAMEDAALVVINKARADRRKRREEELLKKRNKG